MVVGFVLLKFQGGLIVVSGGRGEGAGLKLTPNRFWDNAWQGSSKNHAC
jgi:hypothetical protein